MNDRTAIAAAAGLPRVPAGLVGLRYRAFRDPDDWPALAALMGDAHAADDVDWFPTAEAIAAEHQPNHDPARDHVVAEIDGRLAGSARTWWAVRGDVVALEPVVVVHPDFRRSGLASALMDWAESQLADRTRGAAGGLPRVWQVWIVDSEVDRRELLLARGYEPIRYFAEMVRDLAEPIPDAPLPAGLELRPVAPDQHRAIFEAEHEAFRDHWGHREPTEDDFAARFADPDLDTTLWRVAWDGPDVAGVVELGIYPAENARLGIARGWLDRVSVCRPWRRRGLARALMVSAMRGLVERGMEQACLGVDADNPTGAFGLYESLGFRVRRPATAYRRAVPAPSDVARP